jgi:hypothetical protein
MTRWLSIVVVLAAACTGCTPAYRVYVNGYSEPGPEVTSGASIHVATDPNSQNPIFERQIEAKIETLLEGYGYVPRPERADATYWLDFQAGTNAEKVVGYAPVYHYGGYFGRHYRGYGLGYSTYVPYYDTRYDQWLVMRLHASDSSAENDVVWVGEAMLSTSRAELREAVDFLLVGCVEFLGVDTGGRVTLTIRKDDPRVLSLDAVTVSGSQP